MENKVTIKAPSLLSPALHLSLSVLNLYLNVYPIIYLQLPAYKIIESINAIDRSIDYLVAVVLLVVAVVVVVVVCEDDQIKKSQRDLVQKEKKNKSISKMCEWTRNKYRKNRIAKQERK